MRPRSRRPHRALTAEEETLAGRLSEHVDRLARGIGERNVGRAASLTAAASYIAATLTGSGCGVEGQPFEVAGQEVFNISTEIAGQGRDNEILVFGAHYDTVRDCPGANDNASGVAAVLELARACRSHTFDRTIRFVAFVNEEPPFFQSDGMGSLVYARACRARGERIAGMCAIETIGCYSSVRGSQRYPAPPLGLLYPATGDFIAFVSNRRSRRWLREAAAAFRESTDFPIVAAAVPSVVPGVSWSDHWSFWQVGCPALMITDTAPYRYAHYHAESDTPDKLDYVSLARVVAGLTGMVYRLGGRR